MDLYKWSTTASNNTETPPDGFPEGQLPATVNNAARELMAAVKAGAVIWWDSVASMRTPSGDPETGTRHILLDKDTVGAGKRHFQWVSDNTGYTDNGKNVIIPTSGSYTGGAFLEVGQAEAFVVQSEADISGGTVSAAGLTNIRISLSTSVSIHTIAGGVAGQDLWIQFQPASQGAVTGILDFKNGTNIKGNRGQEWHIGFEDHIYGRYDGTNWSFFCAKTHEYVRTQTISAGVIEVDEYDGQAYNPVHYGGGTASSTLNTINGGSVGCLFNMTTPNSVIVKDGTGNIQCAGDFTLSAGDAMQLLRVSASTWVEVSRSKNV